jgi:ABC-type transport system involved in cytochrome bd biosynthesis fused ATPase/permease subunit
MKMILKISQIFLDETTRSKDSVRESYFLELMENELREGGVIGECLGVVSPR